MARDAETIQAAALWTWSAVAGGVIAALIVQALLTMLALGVGLLAVDLPTAANTPITVSVAALLWWIASGVFSAFVGGAVAGAYAPVRSDRARTVHAVAAWAVASLIVIGSAATATSGSAAVVSNMAGPTAILNARLSAVRAPQAPALQQAQVEQLRQAFATTMFASFIGLLAGALAAAIGGWWARELADELGIPAGATRAGVSSR
jgi:cytochrome bd-type quinol oxidase subunit 2